jgi:hypothetical protein
MERAQIERKNPSGIFPLEAAHQLQIDLIRESESNPDKWIRNFSLEFREFIESHPEIYRLYQKDQKEAREFIRKQLGDKKKSVN